MGLDLAEMLLELEDTFGIALPVDGTVRTVGDIQKIVRRSLGEVAQGSTSGPWRQWIQDGVVAGPAVDARVIAIMAQHLDIAVDQLHPGARLIEDLGLD